MTVIHGFESLTPEQARGIAKDLVGALYLPDLRTIDERVASALADTKASSLHLCGLENLDVQSATELARYRSHGDRVLCLDGLVEASPEVLKALAKTDSWAIPAQSLGTGRDVCVRQKNRCCPARLANYRAPTCGPPARCCSQHVAGRQTSAR